MKRVLCRDAKTSSSTCAVATNHDPVIDPSALSTAIAEAQAVLDVIIPALSDAISENIHRAVELEFVKRDEKISNLEKEVGHLVRQLEQQEQYSRRNCLIVHGIPEVATTSHQPENTDNKVIEVAQQYLDLVIPKESIDRTHRIGSRLDKSGNPRTRPIIMKFSNYNVRSSLYHLRSKFKGANIYVHESLTQERQRWLNIARHHPSVDRTWTQDGRIEIRRKDGDRVVIGCVEDLARLK